MSCQKNKIYNGEVDSVASRINAETRSLLVRIKIINDNYKLDDVKDCLKQKYDNELNNYYQSINLYLKDINSRNQVVRGAAERNAVNAPIQGSAADIIKIAMINIHQKLKEGNFKTKMLLQVHDELVFDAYKEELDTVKQMIKTEMESAYKMSVPLDVEVGTGNDWLEAH